MSNQRPVSTITTNKPGRPKSVWSKAEKLIGSAGVAALRGADLVVVPASIARELALYAGELPPLCTITPDSPPLPVDTARMVVETIETAPMAEGTDNAR